jgi:hypothetical protein
MPTRKRTGNFHAPPGFQNGGYWALQANIGGVVRTIHIYVSDPKADKHAIETYWPVQQPGKHTGITLEEGQFEPLYKLVGIGLVAEMIGMGGGDTWIELEYDARELPDKYFLGDVATKDFKQVNTMIVGGSVMQDAPTGRYIVFINHGPY